jgi:hypothetical protein
LREDELMGFVKVGKDHLDWSAHCTHCDLTLWCEVWDDAMEFACGHVVFQHQGQRPKPAGWVDPWAPTDPDDLPF